MIETTDRLIINTPQNSSRLVMFFISEVINRTITNIIKNEISCGTLTPTFLANAVEIHAARNIKISGSADLFKRLILEPMYLYPNMSRKSKDGKISSG